MNPKKNILFVDDEPRILQGLRRSLYSMNSEWDMTFQEGGQAALDYLKQKPVDVLVTDIRMPEVSGFELLQAVKERYPHIVRIALTGQTSKESFLQSIRPIHQYLSKPCDIAILKSVLERVFMIRNYVSNELIRNMISKLEVLPSLSSNSMQLLQELQSESSSIETITRLITQDMALSVKILQLVNSAYFGIGKTVSSISQAVVLLGTDTLKSLVLTSQLFSHFDTTSRKSISLEELWDHSWIVGKWAQAIAQKETADPETMNLALLTGLVHDIGKLVLAAYMLEKYQEVLHREVEDPSLIYNIERQVLGITHTEVGAYLLGLWGFSPNIVEAVAWHHSPACSSATGGDVLAFVYAANQLTHEFDANPGEDSDSPLSHDSYLESTGFIQHLPDWRLLNPGVKVANTTF